MNPLRYMGWRLLAFVVLLGGFEVYLRSTSNFGRLVVLERSERFGWLMLPDQSRWSRDGDVAEIINGHGYRDRPWEVAADAEPRVAVLGQSITYGTSVAIEDTWPRALEQLVGPESEVMNFAVQGYVLEQMVRVYEDHVRAFKPDVVLLPMHMGDILPMAPSRDEFDFRYRRPWFRTTTKDFLDREIIGKWMPRPKPTAKLQDPAQGFRGHLRDDPANPALAGTWEVALGRLGDLHDMVEADGGRLAVVVLPILRQLMQPDRLDASFMLIPWAAERASVRPDAKPVLIVLALEEFAAGQQTLTRGLIERFGAFTGLPWGPGGMRTLPADAVGFEQRLFLEQDVGHFSPRGHRLLGEVVHGAGVGGGLWR